MNGMNKAYLLGHLGKDPEVRSTGEGASVVSFTLATPSRRKVNEEWVDSPDWHRLTAFGKEAEFLARYARKGDILCVECTIRQNKWVDREGRTHYDVNIVIQRVLWLNSKGRTAEGGLAGEIIPRPPGATPGSGAELDGGDAEMRDIPF